jgi:hypothetical protein
VRAAPADARRAPAFAFALASARASALALPLTLAFSPACSPTPPPPAVPSGPLVGPDLPPAIPAPTGPQTHAAPPRSSDARLGGRAPEDEDEDADDGSPSGVPAMSVPGPTALPCTADAQCGRHRCNLQYGKCAFPCQTDYDCTPGDTCLGAGGPMATCIPPPPLPRPPLPRTSP